MSQRVTGAMLNAMGIVAGGLFGLLRKSPLTPQTQAFFKLAVGVFIVFYGIRLTWLSVNGPFWLVLKQLAIVFLAVMLGKVAGQGLRFQRVSNFLGQHARRLIERTKPADPQRHANGFNACTILFCAAPLGILGAVQDGLPVEDGGGGYFYPLAVKATMDGLATISFVRLFGWGAILAAVPVFVLQGSVTLVSAQYLEPLLRPHGLVDSVNAVGGLIVCTVGLVVFEIRKVELADFLPSLAIAPLLTWLWR